MNEDKITVVAPGSNGEPVEYDVLFTFDSHVTDKSYIAYTDNSLDENGNIKVYASIYDPDNLENLTEIETEEEWNLVNNVLNRIVEEANAIKNENLEGENEQ